MAGVVADTHALVWYLVEPSRLSPTAGAALDQAVDVGDGIYISAISLVELVYLVEKVAAELGLLCTLPVPRTVVWWPKGDQKGIVVWAVTRKFAYGLVGLYLPSPDHAEERVLPVHGPFGP